jgi:hypothetical protein
MRPDRSRHALKKAQALYWGGDFERAAAALVPVLARATRDGEKISEHVRSLLIVIEGTHGPLSILDGYRKLFERPDAVQTP